MTDATPGSGKRQAATNPYSIPLERIDVSDSELYETDTHWGYFERLRREDPVHYCPQSDFGPYWSVTKYEDVVLVEKQPEVFSSAHSIVVGDPDPNFPLEAGFITMDGPRHERSPQSRSTGGGAAQHRLPRAADPAAHRRDSRRVASRRNFRLGRSRVD